YTHPFPRHQPSDRHLPSVSFTAPPTTEISTLSLHDALPICLRRFSPSIAADVKRVLTPEGSVAARRHRGGTAPAQVRKAVARARDRKSTRLNSSHLVISYAVFCLKKKTI